MSYQVLARKWRPRTFKDLIGQNYIVRMLVNALKQQRLHHAYLLTGTRGVGKTTIARILAKCLNCDQGITPTPCETCAACQSINQGKFLDLFEIDAASRTKVEDTRELLDNVMYPPTQGRYKVYLIDEVHMLSNHSFNALLKTLEEPPAHVKFILATTDPKKLPITILSRCLQFHLKRISPELITQHLEYICQQEAISFQPHALQQLALAADGSMRDALSLLDQAIAYGQGEVNTADVSQMLGSVAEEDLVPLLQALAERNGKKLLDAIHVLTEHTPDYHQLLTSMISLLHTIAIQQIVPHSEDAHIKQLAASISAADAQIYYQIALLSRRDLAISPSPQQGFEMAAIRMLALLPNAPVEAVEFSTPAATQIISPSTPAPITLAQASDAALEWRSIVPQLKLTGMAQALANNLVLMGKEANQIKLILSAQHQPLLNANSEKRLTDALKNHLQLDDLKISIDISHDTLASTPNLMQAEENNHRLAEAKQAALNNPHVQKLIEMYDASLEVSLS